MADVTIAAWIFVPFIAASYCFQPASGEVFTGSIDLRNTFRLEEQMVDVLAELLARTEAKLSAIRRYTWLYNI